MWGRTHVYWGTKTDKSLEVNILMNMFALDVIASGAFELQMDKDGDQKLSSSYEWIW